jgi:protein-disulfide isomerase
MPLLRWSPALLALLSMSTCRGPSDPPPTDNGKDTKGQPAEVVSLRGVDASALTPRERREWSAQISELLAPCPDVPVSIAQCATEQRACKTCLPAAQFLLKQVQAGRPKKDREEAFRARFDPAKVKTIVTEGSPELGAPDAPATIIEWADFQCPFCKLVYPMLDDIVRRFDGQARVVYKFYPLASHPQGEIAARAAVAAANQGKFWEMHHVMFDNQERLEQSDLERYAGQLKLDINKFRDDLVSEETAARIEKDKKQADELGLEGTPFIFINGREVDLGMLANPYDDLEAWVKLEVELAGQTPRTLPREGAPGAHATSGAPAAGSSSAAAAAGGAPKPAATP